MAPKYEDPKLIIHGIIFELVHQRHSRTDGRTDGRLSVAMPRFALLHHAVMTEGDSVTCVISRYVQVYP